MGFRDAMNNYFYGRQGQADMTAADLPANRLELFFTVLKVRWSGLVGVNLLYLVAWIPAIAWTALNLISLYGLQARGFTPEDVSGLAATWLMILAPCIAITGPFTAGVTFVLRNWARDEHSFVLSDFKDAVKGNWRQALPVSAISGALPFLSYTAIRFYSGLSHGNPLMGALPGVVLMVAAVWSMMTMVIYDMMVTYRLRLVDLMRNSLLLTLSKLPFAVGIRLLTLALPMIALAVSALSPGLAGYAALVLGLAYLLFVPALNKLIEVSYANWLCETYLNPRIEGARTDIGLRPKDWDDTEYRPEDDA